MRINVAQQLKGHIGESRSLIIDEKSSDGFPIEGKATLTLTHRSILVTGNFKTTVKCICSRCLEEFDQSYTLGLEDEFFPVNNMLMDSLIREDSDREGFSIGGDNILDLNEAFRQSLMVSIPQKPVCQQDCAGLCQKCGSNLNKHICDCAKGHIDPRWSVLQKIHSHKDN